MSRVTAPFTPEQVVALTAWQRGWGVHPFTCGDRADHPVMDGDKGVLIATVRGWICPFCDYTQDWAHDFMCVPSDALSHGDKLDAVRTMIGSTRR